MDWSREGACWTPGVEKGRSNWVDYRVALGKIVVVVVVLGELE